MKKIAFHIQKGGTGKTTMAGNVGFEMRHYGKTLLMDCDPQGNLTSWYIPDGIEYELADVMTKRAALKDAIVQVRENLYILPTIAIDGGLKEWGETKLFQEPYAFIDLAEEVEALGFQYVVYDLGPGISTLEKSILASVNEVVGVASAEFFSFDGLEIFEHELEKLRKQRRASYDVNRLVINRVNRSFALHKAYLEQFDALKHELYAVGQSTGISDCIPSHKSLFEYDPGNKNITELQRLAQDLTARQRSFN